MGDQHCQGAPSRLAILDESLTTVSIWPAFVDEGLEVSGRSASLGDVAKLALRLAVGLLLSLAAARPRGACVLLQESCAQVHCARVAGLPASVERRRPNALHLRHSRAAAAATRDTGVSFTCDENNNGRKQGNA